MFVAPFVCRVGADDYLDSANRHHSRWPHVSFDAVPDAAPISESAVAEPNDPADDLNRGAPNRIVSVAEQGGNRVAGSQSVAFGRHTLVDDRRQGLFVRRMFHQ